MNQTLLLIGASLLAILLVANLLFRMRVWRHYKHLLQGKVDIPNNLLMDEAKLREQIVPRYPDFEQHIIGFSRQIKFSVRVITAMLMIIVLIAAVLYYYK